MIPFTNMLLSFSVLKKYVVKRLIPAVLIIVAGIIFLNFFLAYRLERFLEKELDKRVSKATGGFYRLAFDDLSVNILNGELRIEGLLFVPDSAVFLEWNQKDSLPLTYINAYAGAIDFTGINLIWRRNYRQLNFRTFEIASPDIRVYDAYNSSRYRKVTRNTTSKTLYEMISPYMDVLTVQQLNLTHVSASFMVENPYSPILYALEDVTFHGYGFRIDSSSYERGNLLYCDNFEFFTNGQQKLLTNNNFVLETDSILLSTSDSLLYLEKIRLSPQAVLTDSENTDYLEGVIDQVSMEGVGLRRRDALNYLKARSLNIHSSDISVYDLASHVPEPVSSGQAEPEVSPDSLLNSLSLYDLVSPILHQVSIDHIGIEDARMNYMVAVKDTIEQYQMDNFEFHAWNFLIDSVAEQEQGLWYARAFSIEATGVKGLLAARNHRFRVDLLLLDTGKGILRIENVSLDPLSRRTRNDYIMARIDTVAIDGLVYKDGIEADQFRIESPAVRYFSSGNRNKEAPSSHKKSSRVDVEDIFNPLFRYMRIGDIRLNKANLVVTERELQRRASYRINDLYFFATDFLVNEETWSNENNMFFTSSDYGLRFSGFDNYLPGENYRLVIRDAFFSTKAGELRLDNVRLIPRDNVWNEMPGTYVSFTSPTIRLNGFSDLLNRTSDIAVDSIKVETPDIQIRKADNPEFDRIQKEAEEYTPFSPFHSITVGTIDLDNTRLSFANKSAGEDLNVKYDKLEIRSLKWNTQKNRTFNIDQFNVYRPQVSWKVTSELSQEVKQDALESDPKTLPEILHPYAEKIKIGSFYSDNILLETSQPYLKTQLNMGDVSFDRLDWNFKQEDRYMELHRIMINHPVVNILQTPSLVGRDTAIQDTIRHTIYDQLTLLGNRIAVGNLQIKGAELDYENRPSKDPFTYQRVNRTDFSIKDLTLDNRAGTFAFEDVHFVTENLVYPINDGFYDFTAGKIELVNDRLKVDSFHMVSPYSKTDFAYLHPQNKDWFDVRLGSLEMDGIDLPALLSGDIIRIRSVQVDDPVLLNYKNKKIPVPPKWMPMMYAGLQKAPVKIDVDTVRVNNFEVVYEEISKKGTEPGRLVFTELNGIVTGLTNMVSRPDQFYRLDADGKFYGKGHFEAVWLLPVDSLNDHFILTAHLPDFDLTALNKMNTPLASAELKSGYLNDVYFTMDAGNIGGSIYMLLLYEDIKVNIFKIEEGKKKDKKFLNWLVNSVVRDDNPRHKNGKPKEAFAAIERDPYHSSFNYLWQLLRPPLAESVGVTKTHQKIAMGITTMITKIKGLFNKEKKPASEPEEKPE